MRQYGRFSPRIARQNTSAPRAARKPKTDKCTSVGGGGGPATGEAGDSKPVTSPLVSERPNVT